MAGRTVRTVKEQLTLNDIRYNNKVNIYTDIVTSSGITRNDLAAKNHISIMTVKNIVDDLLGMKLVEEQQMEAAIGRKPMALKVAANYGNIICINLSTIHEIRFIIYDLAGRELAKGRTGFKNQEKTVREKIADAISEIRTELAGISTETVGIAVFVPGVYYEDQDLIKFALIRELNDLPIREIFREAFQMDNIQILHDTYASAASEYALRSGQNDSQFYLYCGDGVGGCYTGADGRQLPGQHLLAGEVGNIIMSWDAEGRPVRLEDQISISGIQDKLPASCSDLEFDQVLEQYEKDPAVTEVLEEAFFAAAQILYNIVWIYNPTRVIVDSYCEDYANLIIKKSKAFFQKHFDALFLQNTELLPTGCDEYHTMLGCMRFVRNRWIEQIVIPEDAGYNGRPGGKEGIV